MPAMGRWSDSWLQVLRNTLTKPLDLDEVLALLDSVKSAEVATV